MGLQFELGKRKPKYSNVHSKNEAGRYRTTLHREKDRNRFRSYFSRKSKLTYQKEYTMRKLSILLLSLFCLTFAVYTQTPFDGRPAEGKRKATKKNPKGKVPTREQGLNV